MKIPVEVETEVEVTLSEVWEESTASERKEFVDENGYELEELVGAGYKEKIGILNINASELPYPGHTNYNSELARAIAWQIDDETAENLRKWLDFYNRGL